MGNMTFPTACQQLRSHFYPIGFEGTLDSPSSMTARLFVVGTGETLLSLAAIPCASPLSPQRVAHIIQIIEADIDAAISPRAPSREQGAC